MISLDALPSEQIDKILVNNENILISGLITRYNSAGFR